MHKDPKRNCFRTNTATVSFESCIGTSAFFFSAREARRLVRKVPTCNYSACVARSLVLAKTVKRKNCVVCKRHTACQAFRNKSPLQFVDNSLQDKTSFDSR